jgi:molybdate transport system substrate-binding protein
LPILLTLRTGGLRLRLCNRLISATSAKFVFGENIAQAAQFAQSGSAQAGILAAHARNSHARWQTVGKSGDSYPTIRQTVVLKAAQDKSAAENFVKFVTEGPGRQLLEQSGFQPPLPSTEPKAGHK